VRPCPCAMPVCPRPTRVRRPLLVADHPRPRVQNDGQGRPRGAFAILGGLQAAAFSSTTKASSDGGLHHDTMRALKSDIPDLPARMRQLPVGARGYPVPYFVAWFDASGAPTKRGEGTPDFRMVHPGTIATCHTDRVCWVCGQPLRSYKTGAAGEQGCRVRRRHA
jgi:hypothetical protein